MLYFCSALGIKKPEGTESPLFHYLTMNLQERLKQLAESFLKDETFFIVDVIAKESSGKQKVLILLDGDEGVTIDDCATLSRAMARHLEEHEVIENAYILEVSSPGLDHPIKLDRQFKKNVGRKFRVHLKDGSSIEAKLDEVTDGKLRLTKELKKKKKDQEPTEYLVAMEEIEKANVLVSFK